jgi:hypothetical protein
MEERSVILGNVEVKIPDGIRYKTTYDPQVMQDVIVDIATSADPVDVILTKYNLKHTTVYTWKALNADIQAAWKAAMVHRTHVLADKLHSDGKVLDDFVDNEDNDPREKTVKIKRFDVRWKHNEWYMSRVNRKDYGDNLSVESNVTVNAAQAREDAWRRAREMRDADYTDVSAGESVNMISNADL